MIIKKGIYDFEKLIILNESEYTPELDVREVPKNNTCLLISFEDIDLYTYDEISYSKFYYHPNVDISYNSFRPNEFMKHFNAQNFFDVIYQINNSISFKILGEWYSFVTNSEYFLQFIIDGNHRHVRIFFKNSDVNFYKFIKGRKKFKRINTVYLPEPNVVSYPMMDYFLFEGYRFYKDNLPNIREIKEQISSILSGLNYYYVGTSIYDHARDIDIYIHDKDFIEATERLSNTGYNKININSEDGRLMFEIPNSSIKLDLLTSLYSEFIEPTLNNQADPLFMYFIQLNYYASIQYDNISPLFKSFRYNKFLDTCNKIGIDNKRSNHYNNIYLDKPRFNKYYEIFSDKNSEELIHVPDNAMAKFSCIKTGDWYYYAIKSKYFKQLVKFDLPFRAIECTVVDGDGCDEVIFNNEAQYTSVRFRFLEDYALIKFKKNE